MSETLTRVVKDGEFLHVHPSCVEAHVQAGWRVTDNQGVAEASAEPEVASAELAGVVGEAIELAPDPAEPKADPLAAARAAKAAKAAEAAAAGEATPAGEAAAEAVS